VHRLGLFDTDIRIVGAHTIFVSRNKQTGKSRITNYEGAVTVYNDKRSVELGKNETLLIDNDGKFEKFSNDFASADSLWLTTGEIWFNNIDMTTLIKRMAINYGCNVQFNFQPSDEMVVTPENFYFDCKSGSLSDGLKLLQTISTESQRFSYNVNDGVITIDKYSE
jgi:protein associated with RNAse G/E